MAIISIKNTIPALSVMGGVPGPPIPAGNFIKMESTGFVLMENGLKIKLE